MFCNLSGHDVRAQLVISTRTEYSELAGVYRYVEKAGPSRAVPNIRVSGAKPGNVLVYVAF